MSAERKPFRIETQMADFRIAPEQLLPREGGTDLSGAEYREIMAAMANLAGINADQALHVLDNVSPTDGEPNEAPSEMHLIRGELSEIRNVIAAAKDEVVAMNAGKSPGTDISRATDELNAVVAGTEQATESILSAAENIDQDATTLLAKLDDAGDQGLADDIQQQVIRIFEACNFQDLTGQRVSKILTTINFIEVRVERMTEILGQARQGATAALTMETSETDDLSLLNGPALEGDTDTISQAEVDEIFEQARSD